MIHLKDYQRTAVNELKVKLLSMLSLQSERQKLVFKAPTGSGKTVMSAALLDELKEEMDKLYKEIAFIWIAPNKLHYQSCKSLRNLFSEKHTLEPIFFDEADCNEGLKSGQVLFLNWESIAKENAVIIRDNEQNRNLSQLVESTKRVGKIVFVIIDEEHYHAGVNAKRSEEALQLIKPKIEFRVSATPTTSGCPLIEVPREVVIEEGMIKKSVVLNPFLKSDDSSTLTINQQLLEKALSQRDHLAKAYYEFNVNPLLLIQLPNDKSDTLSAEEKSLLNELESYLNVIKNINVENEKLAVWLSGRKDNVDGLEKLDNHTDVLIFKQAIALGWDCPRAAVLLIFRDLKSVTFTTQTVGRILRMPQHHHYSNDILNLGYVYTDLSADIIKIVADDINYISTIYSRKREGIREILLDSVCQNRRKTPHVLMSPFKEIFKRVVAEEWNLPQYELFDSNLGWDDLKDNSEDEGNEYKTSENRRKANKHGIRTDVSRIFVRIPRNLKFAGNESVIHVNDKVKFARNQSELQLIFNDFCRKNVGDFEPGQSAEMIRSAIYEFFEEFLGMFQSEAIRVVLLYSNKPKFSDLITKARERYALDYEKRESLRLKSQKEYNSFTWQLPEFRKFSTDIYRNCEKEIFNHALLPYYELIAVSQPEKKFARYLDEANDIVEWWYKNADSGNVHFAVPYTDKEGEPRCFYVDFIILLKNGTVCLFDTKTANSDANAPMKHNALLKYIEKANKEGKHYVGGVIIWDEIAQQWRYPTLPISSTSSLDGWINLDLNKLNVNKN